MWSVKGKLGQSPRVALSVAAVLLIALSVLAAARWASTEERDVRCDKAKRVKVEARGKDYSCLLQIPGHDRGH